MTNEERNARLEELEDHLAWAAAAVANRYGDDRREVLQDFLYTCLTLHEAEDPDTPQEERFLWQSRSFIAQRCKWLWTNEWKRQSKEMRFEEAGVDAGVSEIGHNTILRNACIATWQYLRDEKRALRMTVRDAVDRLPDDEQAWCLALMAGYRKGEAGRQHGWKPSQCTFRRYEIGEKLAADELKDWA